MPIDKVAVGERLQQARGNVNLSQEDVANYIGASIDSVSKWERGLHQPRAHVMGKLSAILHVSEEWILHGDAIPVNQLDRFADLLDRLERFVTALEGEQGATARTELNRALRELDTASGQAGDPATRQIEGAAS